MTQYHFKKTCAFLLTFSINLTALWSWLQVACRCPLQCCLPSAGSVRAERKISQRSAPMKVKRLHQPSHCRFLFSVTHLFFYEPYGVLRVSFLRLLGLRYSVGADSPQRLFSLVAELFRQLHEVLSVLPCYPDRCEWGWGWGIQRVYWDTHTHPCPCVALVATKNTQQTHTYLCINKIMKQPCAHLCKLRC